MKIIKIGTFNKQGIPIGWHIDMDGANKNQPAYVFAINNEKAYKNKEYVFGIIDEKVCVNGIEIVEWTEERDKCMEEGTK